MISEEIRWPSAGISDGRQGGFSWPPLWRFSWPPTACEASDRCDQAQAALDDQGLTFVDKSGAIWPNPAAAIETQNRLQILRLLQALKLGEGDLPSATQPARDLARKRWNRA